MLGFDFWDIFFQATATDSPNEATEFLCQQLKIPFYRFNPILSEKIDTKEMDSEKLVKMLMETKMYCEEQETRKMFDFVVQILHASVKANQAQAMFRSAVGDNVHTAKKN